jgi:hypothetical protein
MFLETGKSYRAKTAAGDQIVFTVIDSIDDTWSTVELDEGGNVEPKVFLNTALLLWISSETQRKVAISKAADEVIGALETSIRQESAVTLPVPAKK